MTVSRDKEYRTRDGKKVRVYATDGEENDEVHGAYFDSGWVGDTWSLCGKYYADSSDAHKNDLVEARPRIKLFRKFNINKDNCGGYYLGSSGPAAFGLKADENTVARVTFAVDVEEGEGLDL